MICTHEATILGFQEYHDNNSIKKLKINNNNTIKIKYIQYKYFSKQLFTLCYQPNYIVLTFLLILLHEPL